ncbi:hypothetical protein B0T22DRAFT_173389 [Podospora appendiculata]|uniref:Ecp2 effector protein domain-containing protein n=1 Tax=Podospora appendiculata TaxID=314037 RepID=A0AAE0XB92_9PEZI|nr:hypothetical protein B0T22DRAFT_173389 [Podospora appendiculata]
MLFTQALLGVAFVSTAAMAFVLPEGLADGSYIAYINSSGHEVHELFSPSLAARLAASSDAASARPRAAPPIVNSRGTSVNPHSRRAIQSYWELWCGCGFNLNHANTDKAVQGIKKQCAAYAGNNACTMAHDNAWYTISNDVVAFLCYGGSTTVSRITTAFSKITEKCGLYIAGSALFEEGLWYELVHGYMRYSSGLDFCANSISSSANHC